jgi:gamma-glutamylcyclotransferase
VREGARRALSPREHDEELRNCETYFAYGSNMVRRRLQRRVPSAQVVGVARLIGYRLRFHKRSNDGSGKCNVLRTDEPQDVVRGIVLEIDPSEKGCLDEAEGLGNGYREATIQVVGQQGQMTAFLYLAEVSAIDYSRNPYTWYKQFVVRGAFEHGLPPAYVEGLQAVVAINDPDKERERRNLALLKRT